MKSLIRKKQYFVVHAPRQCGKTTAFRALMDEINAKGDMAAMYCSVEAVQCISDPKVALTSIVAELASAMSQFKPIFGETAREDPCRVRRGGCGVTFWRLACNRFVEFVQRAGRSAKWNSRD